VNIDEQNYFVLVKMTVILRTISKYLLYLDNLFNKYEEYLTIIM